jgi:TonB-linked SusC/RagA family outer membrane protein
MNWTAALLLAGFLHVSAAGYTQGKITLSLKKASLQKVFAAIGAQSGYTIWYDVALLKNTTRVDIDVKDATLVQALAIVCKDEPLEFSITEKMIVIKAKTNKPGSNPPEKVEIKGRVVNEKGEGVDGATIKEKDGKVLAISDRNGNFEIKGTRSDLVLEVSYIGYSEKELKTEAGEFIKVVLAISTSKLDEVQVIAYGQTIQRYNVGSVTRVSAKEIEDQPVSNPLAALEGRVPSMVVTQGNGQPGSSFTIQIRGKSSMFDASSPLFIIDGVPFASQNQNINLLKSALTPFQGSSLTSNSSLAFDPDYAGSGLSPFNSVNPADIESITILKDADATAIYGSRGANGVILITTKRGKSGKTKFSMNIYSGESHVTKIMPMMNTPEYLTMRHEAFNNDGVSPDQNNAPDLLLFDTTRYTDFKKQFFGSTAPMTDANFSLSGGSQYTQFSIGAGYHHEANIFPGDFADDRGSVNLNLHHSYQHLTLDFSANYSYNQNNTIAGPNILSAFTLPPDYPAFLDSTGKLNWGYKGYTLTNPLSYLLQKYIAKTESLISHFQIGYELLPGLVIRSSFGYSNLTNNETSINPLAAQNPSFNPSSSSNFGSNILKTWIVEPQVEFNRAVGFGKMDFLIGGTVQQNTQSNTTMTGTLYSSDALLNSISSAGNITANNSYYQYKYIGFFARLNYIFKDKYILNLVGRRDGSSRFGPGKQFGNFGSIGGGWIFSKESPVKRYFRVLSFGKLKASYGITGNDQIGDYRYLSTWSTNGTNGFTYQGSGGLLAQNLSNPDFGWELNKKLETGIELGFFKDRILANVTWFQNRSNNQLVNFNLPIQTGFNYVTENLPATIQNRGWEFEVSGTVIKGKHISWSSSLIFTVPANKLIEYPGLASSNSADVYYIGRSLSTINTFRYLGVNAENGLYQFASKAGPTATPIYPDDNQVFINLDPQFYGGLENTFTYKSFRLSIFLDFRKQVASNYLSQIYQLAPPGTLNNGPIALLGSWKQAGDITNIQKLSSAYYGTPAADAASEFLSSDGPYSDASFIRIKTVSLSYDLFSRYLQKIKIEGCRLYLNAQNLFTITHFRGNDPEIHNFYSLPPLRTVVAGIQFTL